MLQRVEVVDVVVELVKGEKKKRRHFNAVNTLICTMVFPILNEI